MTTTNSNSILKNPSLIMFLLVMIIGFSSCSKRLTYFTQSMSNNLGWTESELQKVQFYLSEDITLRRNLGESDSRITKGKIRLVDGREVEEIFFKKGTPGVVIFSPKSERVAVSFEDGIDNYLIFGPNPKSGGRYTLRGKNWNKNSGKITYNGLEYTTGTRSSFAALLVDLKRAEKVKYSSKTVGGRKIER